MLSSAALLALCVQVADLSSLYLSFHPSGAALEEVFDEAELRWVDQLRAEVPDDGEFVVYMHDGFIEAMAMNGQTFWAQWNQCQVMLDGATSPTTPVNGKG